MVVVVVVLRNIVMVVDLHREINWGTKSYDFLMAFLEEGQNQSPLEILLKSIRQVDFIFTGMDDVFSVTRRYRSDVRERLTE